MKWNQRSGICSLDAFSVQGFKVEGSSFEDTREGVVDTSDEPISRLYRVWVDENLACIVRHCNNRKPGSRDYMSCLTENCRRGILKVQRDAEESDVSGQLEAGSDDRTADMAVSSVNDHNVAADFMENFDIASSQLDSKIRQTHLFLRLVTSCFQDNCLNLEVDTSTLCLSLCIPRNGYFTDVIQQNLDQSSKFDLETLEKLVMLDSATNYQYPLKYGSKMTKRFAATALSQQLPVESTSRKRRVNDEVSQCIQSYCGQHSPAERLLCIIEHCHRTRSVY